MHLLDFDVTAPIPAKTNSAQPSISAEQGRATILLVEDEEFLLETSSKTLQRRGYQVLAASSGAEALDIINSNSAIDLLFTDILMPGGMNGIELAEQAVALRPNLKVILTSGYNEFEQVNADNFIKKPYATQDMLNRIGEKLQDKETLIRR